jgi:putative membrane protein
MLGCNYMGSGMGHWGFGGGVIGLGITLLIIVLIVLVLLQLNKSGRKRDPHADTMDSLKILKSRYAKGEITEQEYLRMRDILYNNHTS